MSWSRRLGLPEILLILPLLVLPALMSAQDAAQPINVLVLAFGNRDQPVVLQFVDEFRAELERKHSGPVQIYVEAMDEYLVASHVSYEKAMEEFLARKYANRALDLVITLGNGPVHFLRERRNRLFPKSKIVYVVAPGELIAQAKVPDEPIPQATGVIVPWDIVPTIEIALQQNPGTTRLLLIAGSSPDEQVSVGAVAAALREKFRREGRPIEVETLGRMTFQEARQYLARLPNDTVCLFYHYFMDSAGQIFIPARVLPVLSRVSTRPIYCGWDVAVGRGSVGGLAATLSEVAHAAAGLAARVLQGEDPDKIPPIRGTFQHYVFDWKQMKRWGIRLDQLPPDSIVLNREYTTWELYKGYLLGGSGLLLFETGLLVLLFRLMQNTRQAAEFEALLAELSSRFIDLPADKIDAEIETAQRRICETLGLDRSTLVQFDEQVREVVLTHCWGAPGIPMISQIPGQPLPWCIRQILKGEVVQYSRVDELPEEATLEREQARRYGTKSNTILPLCAGGKVFGALAFGTVRAEREWSQPLTERLQLVAQTLANALARNQAGEALEEGRERMALAVESAKVGLWSRKLGSDEIWASDQTRALFGWPADAQLNYEVFLNSVHPDDREDVRRLADEALAKQSDYRAEYRIERRDGTVRWMTSLGRSYNDGTGKPLRMLGVTLDITKQKRSERELAERLRFEGVLAELSARFVGLPPEQLDGQIDEGQRQICEALSLDRCTLAQLTPDGKDLINTHSWAAPGLQIARGFTGRDLPWTVRTLLSGEGFHFTRIDDLPEEAAKDKETMRQNGLKSNAAFPLMTGGQVFGAVDFGALQAEREWPEPLLGRLGLVAQVFANALARKRADASLREAYSQIELLKDRLEKENVYLREEIKIKYSHDKVIGESKAIRRVLMKAEQVSATDSTVLLLGETGTGKELIATTIHELSRRRDRPMVKVNCAALPASLVENELFGREKGAYTGALTREMGRFELANGSTIFLDEIGELPLELQSKLLRVLQDGEFERLGSPRTIRVDVRVMAATSRDLQAAVKEGKFREDLFYRLNIFPIQLPPLRERREDIPELVWHFVREVGRRMGRNVESIRASTMTAFQNYSWPGNVRELRNVIEHHLILHTGSVFHVELPIAEGAPAAPSGSSLEEMERNHIRRVLETTAGRIRGQGGAAEILGLKPTTLESRMKKLGIGR